MIEPSDTFLGAGASVIALDFLLYRVYSFQLIFWPKYSTSSTMKEHFSLIRRIPASNNLLKNSYRLTRCFSSLEPETRISSTRTTTNGMLCSRLFMVR